MTDYSRMTSLRDRVYIVTGGAGYLGREVCMALASFGGSVYCVGRDPAKFSVFDEYLHNRPNQSIRFIEADVTVEEQVERGVGTILASTGRIDGLFNNAASSIRGIDPDMSMDEWALGLSCLVSHYFLFARVVLREMERAKSGVIVNNASIWGVVSPDPKMYLDLKNDPPIFLPVAKAGVIQLTKYLAVLYAPKGIRVNTITPGQFPQRRGPDRPDYMREMTNRIPMGRIGTPQELAGVVSFLFSDASSYMTGQNLIVDGGYTLW
jgi:NAD(P)-dependent dehydrogenase (short-subunit alcohol dehydrogenase family)